MIEEPFVGIEEVAKHFSVAVSTVRAWLKQDLIPSIKVGKILRFKLSEVEKAMQSLHGGELVREESDGSLTVVPAKDDPQMAINFNLNDDI